MSARPPIPLTLGVRIRVEATTQVDLVTYYAALDEEGRAAYGQLKPAKFTNPGEHQWPIEFIVPSADGDFTAEVGLDIRGDGVRHDHHPTEDIDVHLTREPYVRGRRGWSVEDFDLLRAQVPWLDAFHRRREGSGHECEGCGDSIRNVDGAWEHLHGGWVSDHPVVPREPSTEDRIRVNAGLCA